MQRAFACRSSLSAVRGAWLTGLALLAGAALSGCTIPVPDVSVGAAITEAVPLAGAIEFRTSGGPLDEGLPDAARLTLEDAVRRALQADPGLQAALARVNAARAEAQEAGMPPDPVLDVVLRYPEGGGSLLAEAGLGIDIVTLLRTPRRASAAHNRLRAEAARALTTALDLLQDVQTRYAAVQALEALRIVLEDRRGTVLRLREVAEARLEVGEGTRGEVVAFEAERLAIEIEAAERINELREERLALARLIGEPSGTVEWELDPFTARQADLGDESAWIAAALRKRPEIQAAEWELLALGDDLALAPGSPFESTTLGLDAEKDGDWSAGPGASIPLPIFGRGQVRKEGAFARQVEGRHLLTEAQRVAVQEVRSALAVLRLSASNVDRLRSELIPLQERRRTDVQRAFDERELDVTALLIVDQSLQEARARLLELERQAATAKFRLERAVGGPATFETTREEAMSGGHRDE